MAEMISQLLASDAMGQIFAVVRSPRQGGANRPMTRELDLIGC
jgi:hypothetical protein